MTHKEGLTAHLSPWFTGFHSSDRAQRKRKTEDVSKNKSPFLFG